MKDNTALFTLCLIAALLIIPAVQAENVYRDNNPALFLAPPESHGYAIFMIRCGGSAMDTTVLFRNMDFQQNLTLPAAGWLNVSRNLTEGGWGVTKVLPDGRSDIISFAAGNYEACLRDGNGGQPECQQFHIGGAATETVGFTGHAISIRRSKPIPTPEPTAEPTPEPTVTPTPEPTPGECYEEQYIITPAWDETIPGQPAWEEVIYHPEVNHTLHYAELSHDVFHQEINHTEYFPEVNHTVYHEEINHTVHHDTIPAVPGTAAYYTVIKVQNGHGNCDKVYYGSYDFKVDNQKYKFDSHGDYQYTYHPEVATIPAVPAWDEIVVDQVAYTIIVVDSPERMVLVVDFPEWTETIIDQEAHDEIIIDTPAWTETIQHPEVQEQVIHHEAEYGTRLVCPDEPPT